MNAPSIEPVGDSVTVFGPFSFDEKMRELRSATVPGGHVSRVIHSERAFRTMQWLVHHKGDTALIENLCRGICGEFSPRARARIGKSVGHIRKLLDQLQPGGGRHIVNRFGKGYALSDVPEPIR